MNRLYRFLPRIFFKGRMPVHLTYFVTDACDSHCGYCFYRGSRVSGEKILAAAEVEKVARSFSSPLLWLLLSGGEPLLHPEIEEICASFYRHTRPVFLVIPTNCLRPEAIAASLERISSASPLSTVVAKLSLDGWGEEHDRLRGVPGNFEHFLRTGLALADVKRRRANLVIGVNTVILPQNQFRLEDLRRRVAELGWVDYHNFSLVRGAGVDARWKNIDVEQYRRFATQIRKERFQGGKLFDGARFKVVQDSRQREMVYRVLKKGRKQLACYAGRLNLVMTETGDIHPCEMISWKLGNVREAGYNLKAIINGPEARKCRRAIAAGLKDCDRCTNECYLITNILFNPGELIRVAGEAVFSR